MNSDEPKRILYAITKSNFGGAQRYVYDLAINAKKKGNEVAVLVGGDGLLKTKLESQDIKVFSAQELGRDVSFFKDIKSFFYILKIIREWKPDVFHTNSSKMGIMGVLAGRIMMLQKIIFTAHGWAFNEDRPDYVKSILKFFYWLIIILSHETICVSEATRKNVAEWPLVQKKLKLIRNGVGEFELTPRESVRKELGIHEEDMLVVGTIAELHHIKGLDTLLHAWASFIGTHHAHLIIIGEGDERVWLEKLIENLGISNSVTLKGYLDNAKSLLKAFDIFVLPSRSEGLPYVLLETGVAQLPVIATSVGGIPEIIEDGETGILVPPEDPEMISLSLTLFAENAELRNKLALNLNRKISTDFSIEKMVDDTLKTYE